jgi:hypothetical protein
MLRELVCLKGRGSEAFELPLLKCKRDVSHIPQGVFGLRHSEARSICFLCRFTEQEAEDLPDDRGVAEVISWGWLWSVRDIIAVGASQGKCWASSVVIGHRQQKRLLGKPSTSSIQPITGLNA